MKTKILLTGLSVTVLVLAGLAIAKHEKASEAGAERPVAASAPLAPPVPLNPEPPPPAPIASARVTPQPQPATPDQGVVKPGQKPQTPILQPVAQVPAPGAKAPPEDPMARVALSYVGDDLEAEAYWTAAINDPTLPAEERQDLIEDLNEDGLSDPKHPGPEDLAMILNRLRLIEELAPYAMDQVNEDAFKEAYKDLVNLANLTVGRGEPVN